MWAALLLLLLLPPDRPDPPRLIHPPTVLTTRDEVRVTVWSEPHPERRAVILEAWLMVIDDTTGEPDLALVRSSSEPATDVWRAFQFRWPPFREGIYVLYARVLVPTGLTYRSPTHRLEVR